MSVTSIAGESRVREQVPQPVECESAGHSPHEDVSERCSVEPLFGTDKYRIARPALRPEQLNDG